ncbi:MAG: aldehyde ferredoxin oxidoreductase [Chloroflexi bacterium]|nr:aldehyde ferredoxin oxidoreductase [Chloroflexota bacterium]MCL5107948.1 aldehyde ferredoxin oxidoreductase [Chloroflexota bacterium]
MDRVLRVDMSALTVREETLPTDLRALGGRGLCDKVLLAELDPLCDPLGPHNELVFATGIFAGLVSVSSSGRISVGTKSPLTGGIKESNGGGTLGHKLGRLGYRMVVVEGQAPTDQHFVLKIDKSGGSLLPATGLWGARCFVSAETLRGEHGPKVSIATIGPAGERGYLLSGIGVTDMEGGPNRYCARGGVGAVMGKRGLKAVVVDDAGGAEPAVADREGFKAAAKRLNQALMAHPITGDTYPRLGTPGLVSFVNQIGAFPTHNFSRGSFEAADEISGEKLYDTIVERGGQGRTTHSCMPGCVIRSSNVFANKLGRAYCSPIEFETLGLCGSNIGLGTLDAVAEVNRWCNDFGVDTIELGATLGVAMDAGIAKFGDLEDVRHLLREMERDTMLGRILGSGTVGAARVLGVSRVPTVLGQAVSAYDPRVVKGNGVTYMTSPQGADHTAGNTIRIKTEHTDPLGKVALSHGAQISAAAIDTVGLCLFAGAPVGANQDLIRDLVATVYGEEVPADYWTCLGTQVLSDEWAFNDRAGVPPIRGRMPELYLKEALPPTGSVFDVPLEEIEEVVRF